VTSPGGDAVLEMDCIALVGRSSSPDEGRACSRGARVPLEFVKLGHQPLCHQHLEAICEDLQQLHLGRQASRTHWGAYSAPDEQRHDCPFRSACLLRVGAPARRCLSRCLSSRVDHRQTAPHGRHGGKPPAQRTPSDVSDVSDGRPPNPQLPSFLSRGQAGSAAATQHAGLERASRLPV
jgi:hypothetical protein